eukprot:Blabericola_migrator_1__7418@NODE_377_length_9219_cov_163_315122_g301_i0_p5_GENE_NODE_377_length_9219_cov_163_315122_g301_i0NODE_377_length_9219_cov_163_315122_g301_i0_p5_ORF_typecomplete_len220_score42_23Methyltransf_11/PF08241_12/7_4e16Methyltransf_23/PF13489_6/7e13Methyltransf_25/PF13649_6/3_4e12Methyltransf_31/PF13847_6/2_4e11TehB/PF03848_14/2e07MTS/PF05175_14/1_9e06Methyltransf_12/PF08242_12/2_4e06MetW/PF07021_12/6e06Ubie_methyltran/PF01209_18/8_4e06PrmA/PF06325_13/2_6e05CMAS/PF02353_20/4_6
MASSTVKPELAGPPQLFYNDEEAEQYTTRSRIGKVQAELSSRAIELMSAGTPLADGTDGALILDIGCGSGISGGVLSEQGYTWIGMDISPSMLRVAQENDVEGDMILSDIGNEMRFRPGTFDGAISVSVVQWLCHSYAADQDPRKRLRCFFSWLYRCLNHGARAVSLRPFEVRTTLAFQVLQFYPSHEEQKDLIAKTATSVGFIGGFVVDNPDSEKNRK